MLPDHDASALFDADATRRSFLKKVAVGGAAAAIGTQVLPFGRLVPGAGAQEEGDGAGGDGSTTDTTEADTAATANADEQRMVYLAGLALAASRVYRTATGGDTSDDEAPADTAEETTTTLPPIAVPPLAEPVVEILRVFGSHHAQQAVALGATVPAAAAAPNGTFQDEVRSALAASTDEGAVLTTLRQMEERLAATHLAAVRDLTDTADASLVASALPIVSQHAVVLGRIGTTPAAFEELVPELQTTDDELVEALYPDVATGGTGPTDTGPDANAGGAGAEGGTGEAPGDGTDTSGGGAGDGSTGGAGNPADTESGN